MHLPILNSISRPISCCLNVFCGSKLLPPTKIVKTDIIRLSDVPIITIDVYKCASSHILTIRAENPLVASEPVLEANSEEIQSSDLVFPEIGPESQKTVTWVTASAVISFLLIAIAISMLIFCRIRKENPRRQVGPLSNVNSGSGTSHSSRYSKSSTTTIPFESRPLPPGVHPDFVVPVAHPLKSRKGQGIAGATISPPKRIPTRQPRHVMPLPILIPTHRVEGSKIISSPPAWSPVIGCDTYGKPRVSCEHLMIPPATRQRRVQSLACDRRALLAIASHKIDTRKVDYKSKPTKAGKPSLSQSLAKIKADYNKAEEKKAKKEEGKEEEGKEEEDKKGEDEQENKYEKLDPSGRVLSLIIEE